MKMVSNNYQFLVSYSNTQLNSCPPEVTLLRIFSCKCKPVTVRLLYAGYFPCAPRRPSLAFTLKGLETMKNVWSEIAPNVTGWAEGWERCLCERGYKLGDRVSCCICIFYSTFHPIIDTCSTNRGHCGLG